MSAFAYSVESAAAAGGADRIWHHDWRLDSDADYNADPLSSIDGLPVAMTSNGAWGPNGGNGARVVAGGTWAAINMLWSDISSIMNRPLAHGDTLVFEVQHALASNSLTVDYSTVLGQAWANPPTQRNVYAGLFRAGGFNRNMRFWSGGWPPGNTVLSDTYAGYRSTSHWVRTGAVDVYCSTEELSADNPLSGAEGPFSFGPDPAAFSKNLKTTSLYDFTTASGRFRFFLEKGAGETAPCVIEAASIWLLPGTPNV